MGEGRDGDTGRRPRLDRPDRITRADRVRRLGYRLRGRLLCVIARHDWAQLRNPEVGGRAAVYRLCRRCGRERNEYSPRAPRNVAGGGG